MKQLFLQIREFALSFFSNKDLVAKVLSFLLAVILWAYISSSKSAEMKVKITVEKQNLPDNVIVTQIDPEAVIVKIEGNRDLLKTVNTRNIRVFTDLKDIHIGETAEYPLSLIKREIAEGITVTLNRSTVQVQSDYYDKKNVRVIPKITGQPEKGILLGKIRVNPAEVTISGPRTLVGGINAVYTEEVSVANLSSSAEREVAINIADLKGIGASSSQVSMSIQVVNVADLAGVDIPITFMGAAPGFTYTPSVATVKVYYRPAGKRDPGKTAFTAVIDVSALAINRQKIAAEGRVIFNDVSVILKVVDGADPLEIITHMPDEVNLTVAGKEQGAR